MTTGLTGPEFDACFQRFADSPTSTTVFRWEGLQHYAIAADEPSLVAFREGTPRPERSVRTSPWLARIAASTIAGKRWTRVRWVSEPLIEYVEWEMYAYVESQAVGEEITFVPEREYDLPDFWVFDGTGPDDRRAILMHYDGYGVPGEFEYVDDEHRVADLLTAARELYQDATPLNVYLALRRGVAGAA